MAPFQNRPVSAWSAEAALLFTIPNAFTSLKTSVYASLANAGGGPGRNWFACCKANGVTWDQCVNCGCAGKLGGVDWKSPGAFPKTNSGGLAFDPSLLRS